MASLSLYAFEECILLRPAGETEISPTTRPPDVAFLLCYHLLVILGGDVLVTDVLPLLLQVELALLRMDRGEGCIRNDDRKTLRSCDVFGPKRSTFPRLSSVPLTPLLCWSHHLLVTWSKPMEKAKAVMKMVGTNTELRLKRAL